MPGSLMRASLVAGFVFLAGAHAAQAQFVTIEARAGRVNSYGDARDVFGNGRTIGVGVSSQIDPMLRFRVDYDGQGSFDKFKDAARPDLRLDHLTGSFETSLLPVRGGMPLSLTASLGGGATRVRQGAYTIVTPGGPLDEAADTHYFPTVTGGLRLGLDLTRNFGVAIGASGFATIVSRENSRRYVDPTGTVGFTNVYTVPVTAAVRIRF